MIEETLYYILNEVAPTYPILHQKQYPCITYNIISGLEKYSHSGNSNLKEIVVQITAWSTFYSAVKLLQSQIFEAIDSYKSTEIRAVFLENKLDLYDFEVGVYYCPNDYRILYRED